MYMQKYRSHRKHLLAREAEAASWTQRRQMYGSVAATAAGGGGVGKREMNPWLAPTMGFPPMTPMHHPHPHHHFRPLHVWGHPTVDQSIMHMWPKHPSPPPPVPPPAVVWPPAPPPPPSDPSYWHHPQRVSSPLCLFFLAIKDIYGQRERKSSENVMCTKCLIIRKP